MKKQQRTDYWQQQLTLWQHSALSGPEFCKQQSLVYHQFVYWRQKLNDNPEVGKNNTGFAQVICPPTRSNSELCISLPNGLTITGLHEHNLSLLTALLRLL